MNQKLTEADVEYIRNSYGQKSLGQLSDEMGVCKATIRNVITNDCHFDPSYNYRRKPKLADSVMDILRLRLDGNSYAECSDIINEEVGGRFSRRAIHYSVRSAVEKILGKKPT